MFDSELYRRIADECGCALEIANANEITTFKGGGYAFVFTPKDEKEFVFVYGVLENIGHTPFILGGGSNTIIADGVCPTPVISARRLCGVKVDGNMAYAQCGARISDVTAILHGHGLSGFEFLSGVPATVGGAVRMNAGAFSHQMSDYLVDLRVLKVYSVANGECDDKKIEYRIENVSCNDRCLSYRRGINETVLGATFRFEKKPPEESVAVAREYREIRIKKQPKFPSCGSVFKNGNVPSGKLIEDCGLKGTRIGNAMISEMHGNFIINLGGAKAGDFIALAELCEREVKSQFGIALEREFVYLQ